MSFGDKIDSLISAIAPGWGLQRIKARQAADLIRASADPRRNRLNPNPNAQRWFEPDWFWRQRSRVYQRQFDRDDSRQLYDSNALAKACVDRFTDYIVGNGIECRSSNPDSAWAETATAAFWKWAASPDFEDGRRNLTTILSEHVRNGRIDGDCGLALVEDDDAGTSQVHLLTADRIYSTAMSSTDGNKIVDGIEIDDLGRPLQFWIKKENLTAIPFPAEKVLFHRYQTRHPDDIRGDPAFRQTYAKFVQLDSLYDSVAAAAELAARLAFVFETADNVKFNQGENGTAPQTDVERASIITIPAGSKVSPIQGAQPTQALNPFSRDLMQQISAAEGIPLCLLLLDFEKGSFSSVNAAMVNWSHQIKNAQHRLIDNVLIPLWQWWVDREIRFGRLPDSAGRYDVIWTPKPPTVLFPEDQAKADATLRDLGLKSFPDLCEERGIDWRRQLDEIAESEAYAKAKGVRLARSSATRPDLEATTPAGGTPAGGQQ